MNKVMMAVAYACVVMVIILFIAMYIVNELGRYFAYYPVFNMTLILVVALFFGSCCASLLIQFVQQRKQHCHFKNDSVRELENDR